MRYYLVPFRDDSASLPGKNFLQLPGARARHHTLVWATAKVALRVVRKYPGTVVLCPPEGMGQLHRSITQAIVEELGVGWWERPRHLCTPQANLVETIYSFRGTVPGNQIWVMQPTTVRDITAARELSLMQQAHQYVDTNYDYLWVSAVQVPGYYEKYLTASSMHYGPPPRPMCMGPRQACTSAHYPTGTLFGYAPTPTPDGKRCRVITLKDVWGLDIDTSEQWQRLVDGPPGWWKGDGLCYTDRADDCMEEI